MTNSNLPIFLSLFLLVAVSIIIYLLFMEISQNDEETNEIVNNYYYNQADYLNTVPLYIRRPWLYNIPRRFIYPFLQGPYPNPPPNPNPPTPPAPPPTPPNPPPTPPTIPQQTLTTTPPTIS